MSKSPPAKPRARKGQRGHYLLRLFMAGNGPNSQKALANLRSLCQEHLEGRYTIETVDVVQDFRSSGQGQHIGHPGVDPGRSASQGGSPGQPERFTHGSCCSASVGR